MAYESNAQETQFLQGWLLLDRFVLKSAFGAPYEFLWANPYQPGLPFDKLPLRSMITDRDAVCAILMGRRRDLVRLSQRHRADVPRWTDSSGTAERPSSIGPAMILSGPA